MKKTWLDAAAGTAFGLSVPGLILGPAVMAIAPAAAAVEAAVAGGPGPVLRTLGGLLQSRLGIALMLMFLAWAVSAAGSIDPARSYFVWARVAVYIALACIVWHRLSADTRLLDYSMRVMAAGAIAAAALAVLSLYVWPEPIKVLRGATPEAGAAQVLKAYASAVACLVPPVLWYGWQRGGLWRLLALSYPAMAVAIAIGTKSGSAKIGLTFGLAAMVVSPVVRRLSHVGTITLLTMLGLAAIGALVGTFALLPPIPFEGLDSLRLPVSVIDAHRQVIWAFTLEHVAASPWLGVGMNVVNDLPGAHSRIVGIGSEYVPSHPHNWVLEILVETGAVGLTLLAAALTLLAWKIVQRLHRRHAGAAAAAGLFVAFWTMSLSNFSIWASWWQATFLMLLTMLLAVRRSGFDDISNRGAPGLSRARLDKHPPDPGKVDRVGAMRAAADDDH